MLTTLVLAGILIATLILTTALTEAGQPLELLFPSKQYLSDGLVVIVGGATVEAPAGWMYVVALARTTPDTAAALRIIARLAACAIIVASVVSMLTANPAAALTAGSFAGLVAGLATQVGMGNAVAGVFMAISRPFRVGNNLTVGANSGIVWNINLMHTVLDAGDREILIPSSTIVT